MKISFQIVPQTTPSAFVRYLLDLWPRHNDGVNKYNNSNNMNNSNNNSNHTRFSDRDRHVPQIPYMEILAIADNLMGLFWEGTHRTERTHIHVYIHTHICTHANYRILARSIFLFYISCLIFLLIPFSHSSHSFFLLSFSFTFSLTFLSLFLLILMFLPLFISSPLLQIPTVCDTHHPPSQSPLCS